MTIHDLQKNAKLTVVSATSIVEGGAHDVILKDTSGSEQEIEERRILIYGT